MIPSRMNFAPKYLFISLFFVFSLSVIQRVIAFVHSRYVLLLIISVLITVLFLISAILWTL